ncbi:hypothetical protein [Xanthobacter sp. YC-JY1]|uniref:hypothetical protein n=1 Tax=Xanthobacter sp. YC-JY1 TaxID=2419844 RepID=UPI001F26FCDC|nr:hypothetical protein [Xanthobacter sp. YC-JY1]UJX45742.1 hypothetical protein D7006_14205 [Xanthobacter sp. YC-JY1]
MRPKFDERDAELLALRIAARDAIPGPRIGDYLVFPDGHMERFSYDWGDDIQTSPGGTFYLDRSGLASFSGGLNEAVLKARMLDTGAALPGSFWFFHHDWRTAHNGVDVTAPCRVFRLRPEG